MMWRLLWCPGCLTIFVAVGSAASGSPRYGVTDLGVLDGDEASWARAVNNQGHVVGESGAWNGQDSVSRAFMWDGSAIHALPTLPGSTDATAWAINDSDCTVGECNRRACLWGANGVRELAPLPGGSACDAVGINNLDQPMIVGDSVNSAGAVLRPCLWDSAGPHELATPRPQNREGGAEGVSDLGVVVGWYKDEDWYRHAAVWDASGLRDIHPQGFRNSRALGVNNLGDVVGQADDCACLWDATGFHDLGTLDHGAYATAINDLDQIVGLTYVTGTDDRAFLWERGVMTDLNTMIPADSGWILRQAEDINDLGQIVGDGYHNGAHHAFLLTPIPEPAMLSLLALGGLAAVRRCRRT